MDDLDKKIKKLWYKFYKHPLSAKKEDCPGDRLLACYNDGMLKEQDKERIEQHLLVCNDCLDLVLLQEKVRREEAHEAIPDVPRRWIEKAINLFPEKEKDITEGLFDIALKFAKDAIEVIRNPGHLLISYGAVPVPVRGEEKTLSTNLITLSKTFSDEESEVEVERIGKGRVNLKVMTKGVKSGAYLEGIRVSLFNPSREIASYVAESGEVFFAGIRLDKYVIKIIRLGTEIGQISLNLKE